MIEFFDKAGNKLAERFPAAEDFSSLLREVLTMPGFHVEGYTGDFLAVYQVIRSWHGDWRYDLKMTGDGRFILISRGAQRDEDIPLPAVDRCRCGHSIDDHGLPKGCVAPGCKCAAFVQDFKLGGVSKSPVHRTSRP